MRSNSGFLTTAYLVALLSAGLACSRSGTSGQERGESANESNVAGGATASLSFEGSRAFWRMSSDPSGTRFTNFYIVQARITNTGQGQLDFDSAQGWFRDVRTPGPGESSLGSESGPLGPGKTLIVNFDSSHAPERDFQEFSFELASGEKTSAGPFTAALPALQSLPLAASGGSRVHALKFETR